MHADTLIDSIQFAPTKNLKQAYVLMTKASITKIITSKHMETTDVIQQKKIFADYQQVIDEEIELIPFTKEEMPFEMITLFARHYNVSLSTIDTKQGLDEFAEQILGKTVQSYRSMNKNFTGKIFEDVVHDFFKQIFVEIGRKYQEASEKEREELENAVVSFIKNLPEHLKETLRKELHVANFTQQMIKQIATSNGIVGIFNVLVKTIGISFYIEASSLLKIATRFLGLPVPTSADSNMSSLIAILASPIALFRFSSIKQRSKVVEMVDILAIIQLFFSRDREKKTIQSENITQQWTRTYEQYQQLLKNIQAVSTDTSRTIKEINRYSEDKSTFEQKIANVKKKISEQHDNISIDLQTMRLDKLAEHNMLVGIVDRLQVIESEINTRSKKIVSDKKFIDKVKARVINTKNTVLVKERERKRKKLYHDMASLIVRDDVPLFDVESNLISDLKDQNIENHRKLASVIDKIEYLKQKRKFLAKKLPLLETERKEMIKYYPGINKVERK